MGKLAVGSWQLIVGIPRPPQKGGFLIKEILMLVEGLRLLSPEVRRREEMHTVRILPLQLRDPDMVRAELIDQLKTGRIAPREIALTQTYILLKGADSRTPWSAVLIGGRIPFKDEENGILVSNEEAAIRNLDRVAHAHGVHASDLVLLRNRQPYSWSGHGTNIRCQDTLFAAPMPVVWEPMALDPTAPHHEFMPLSPKGFVKLLNDEEIRLPDGRRFRLIGNLRRHARDRRQDHRLEADEEDVQQTRRVLADAVAEFESRQKQLMALILLELADKKYQAPADQLDHWRKKLAKYNLVDQNSRDQFETQYQEFLGAYLKNLKDNHSGKIFNPNVRFMADFVKAYSSYYFSVFTDFNRRLPTQGSFLQIRSPVKFGQISQDDHLKLIGADAAKRLGIIDQADLRDIPVGPEEIAGLVEFAYDAFSIRSWSELWAALLHLQRMLILQKSIPEDMVLSDEEEEAIIKLNLLVAKIYDTFMRHFYPEYPIFKAGLNEEELLKKWRRVYARHSQHTRDHFERLTNETMQSLSSHPRYPLALRELELVSTDQLIEHLLGVFGINPHSVGPTTLPERPFFEYRRRIINIIESLWKAELPYEEGVAENTYFLREVLLNLAKPGTSYEPYFLISGKDVPRLIPQSTPRENIRGEILKQVSVIATKLDGEEVKIFFIFSTKEYEQFVRKSQSRDIPPEEIKDITRITIGIDSSSLPKQVRKMPPRERQLYCNQLIYSLEEAIKASALKRGYVYTELTDPEYKREDNLSGEKKVGKSEASIPHRQMQKYVVLTRRDPISSESEMHEIQFFPDLEAYVGYDKDYPRYRSERLRTSRLVRVRNDAGQVVDMYMAYPKLQLDFPPNISDYRESYLDLMVGRKEVVLPLPRHRVIYDWFKKRFGRK